jgi:two-component system, chemotaxis family, sensor kinase CheA
LKSLNARQSQAPDTKKIMVNDEAIREFLVESHEGLDQLDREFVALEADPAAHERIATIFRTIHTVKGTSGFLGYSKLEALAHSGESLLVLLRDGTLSLTSQMTSALLALVDKIRISLKSIEADGTECPDPHTALRETLAALCVPGALAETVAAVEAGPLAERVLAEPEVERAAQPSAPAAAEPVDIASEIAASSPDTAADDRPKVVAGDNSGSSAIADSNVRVDVGLLDKLMNLVGELVLARNQILQFGIRIEDLAFVGASQRLNLITTELQGQVMRTRMQPIGNVWSRLPRVVRDLAVICGKQVRVEMVGKTTELDRTIIEAIKDPLTHIVRNAVDHGIEAPEIRVAAGKPRTGTLILRAFHQGGLVNIEISDDGGGLNLDRVRKKALERNLVTAERLSRMSEYELVQLIFLPGFSTAENVTNVSGRGVGMDVVKTHIERIGGSVDMISELGVGTTLKIRIPLTLAIVPALVVVSSGQRYAIPQTNLLELVRLEGDQARSAVETVHGAPVYRLRGRLLPLVYLSRALGAERDARTLAADAAQQAIEPSVNIIVLQADEGQIGLVVDEVRDTEEIVVKPLGKELKGIPVFAGATIMGDGCVALILDVMGLAQHVGAVARARDRASAASAVDLVVRQAIANEKQALLLFRVGEETTMAIPLALVARIEELPQERIERSGNTQVVQYRGELLQLIDLSELAAIPTLPSAGPVPVIVYSEGGRSVGFVVGRILDVVEERLAVGRSMARNGVLGAVVVDGKVTDLLDVQGVIQAHAPWFFNGVAA